MALQLLKRPRPLPAFKDEEKGIYAQWKIKGFYYRKAGFPKMSVKGVARIRYAKLEVEGKLPHFTVSKQLVNIGYVENVNDDILDIRGCDFRLLIFGVQHVETLKTMAYYGNGGYSPYGQPAFGAPPPVFGAPGYIPPTVHVHTDGHHGHHHHHHGFLHELGHALTGHHHHHHHGHHFGHHHHHHGHH
ncbi:hypothetical protein B9Z55_025435 [Caenorhabditis nigoni]|uniref:Uncharacterized protein n=1 Tax=Caenorhabditis nigoni TaxID=1611254 RepID=A0A2G5SZ66_9PELO|nr:hypothetical protein B9Z55_025435 [Caenorhabditis nigoni]